MVLGTDAAACFGSDARCTLERQFPAPWSVSSQHVAASVPSTLERQFPARYRVSKIYSSGVSKEDFMPSLIRKRVLRGLAAVFTIIPAAAVAQAPKAATYITDEEVKAVNATPGIDRTIRVVDIGNEHFAVGIIHRGATGGAARGTGAAGGGAGRGADTAA